MQPPAGRLSAATNKVMEDLIRTTASFACAAPDALRCGRWFGSNHLSKGVEATVPCHAGCRDIEDGRAPHFLPRRTGVVKFDYYVFASASIRTHTRCCIRRHTQASRIDRAAINRFGTCLRLRFPEH